MPPMTQPGGGGGNASTVVNTALANDSCDGRTIVGLAGEAWNAHDHPIVYFKAADSRWWKAKADAYATTRGLIGIVVDSAAKNAGDPIVVLLPGPDNIIRCDTHFALTINAQYFLSAATGGALTAADTPPAVSVQQVRRMGYGYAATIFLFDADGTVMENL